MNRYFLLALGLVLLGMAVGCSSSLPNNVADVSGLVTVDGKPATGAMVSFSPEGQGRTSFGLTNEEGHYQLIYTNEIHGAIVGRHFVSINNRPPPGQPQPDVLVPLKFSREGQLSAEVIAGEKNEINFELTSR